MTDATRPDPRAFRQRLLAREPMIGTFMKTPGAHNTEIIGGLGYDFVVLDAEHAPWDRGTLDTGLLAARAVGTASIVRIGRPDAASILSVLDDGAVGIMVPHVDSAEMARDIVSWSHYKGGSRGLGIGRGGEYGGRGADHIPFADKTTTVIAMIEDREAIEVIDDIAAVPGVDCLFLGRGDLGLSLSNATGKAPTLKEAVEIVAAAARRHDKPLAAVVPALLSDEAKWLIGLGVTGMMVLSDQSFMRQAAAGALQDFKAAYGRGKA
ncbi:MAG: aldolase/citrate lyase family protein [Gammaproteobacteria bacterium]